MMTKKCLSKMRTAWDSLMIHLSYWVLQLFVEAQFRYCVFPLLLQIFYCLSWKWMRLANERLFTNAPCWTHVQNSIKCMGFSVGRSTIWLMLIIILNLTDSLENLLEIRPIAWFAVPASSHQIVHNERRIFGTMQRVAIFNVLDHLFMRHAIVRLQCKWEDLPQAHAECPHIRLERVFIV